MGFIPPTSGSSGPIPHHKMGSIFSQLNQDLNAYLKDPSEQNFEKLLGDIQQLQNNPSLSNQDHQYLDQLKALTEDYQHLLQLISELTSALKLHLTPEQQAQIERELNQASIDLQGAQIDMQTITSRLS